MCCPSPERHAIPFSQFMQLTISPSLHFCMPSPISLHHVLPRPYNSDQTLLGAIPKMTTRLLTINAPATIDTSITLPLLAGNLPLMT